MEAFVLVIGDFLVAALAAGAAALVGPAILAVGGAGSVIARIARRRSGPDARSPEVSGPITPRRTRRWGRRATFAVFAAGAMATVGILIVNLFLVESLLRWALEGVRERTGAEVTFGAADANLFTGRLTLEGLTLRRPRHATSQFDLRADACTLNLSMTDLLLWRVNLDELAIRGVRGQFERVRKVERMAPRREFEIERLTLEDADVVFNDATDDDGPPVAIALHVDQLCTSPFASRWAVFDTLFRSNANGAIDGQPFAIESRPAGDGRETHWTARSLPITTAAAVIGGPLSWMKRGVMDVDVTDRWQRGGGTRIELDYRIVLRDVEAVTPARGAVLRGVGERIVTYVNEHGAELPLAFTLTLDQGRFEAAASPEAAGLGAAAADALLAALADAAGVPGARLRELSDEATDRAKRLLKRERR